MTLYEVWILFNQVIRGDVSIDVDRKITAINQGYNELARRMLYRGVPLNELMSNATDVASLISTNYVALPSDFLSLIKLYRKIGTSYEPLYKDQIVDYECLLDYAGSLFLDSTNTGTVTMAAIKEPRIWFDMHFLATGTDDIRIIYNKLPSELVNYDKIAISGTTGTFAVGDTVYCVADKTAASSTVLATATVYTVNASYLYVTDRSGDFNSGQDVVVGDTDTPSYTATADITANISEKPQVIEVSTKYKFLLANAAAVMYLYMEDDQEAEAKDKTLNDMIDMFFSNNNAKSNIKVSFRNA